MCFCLLPVTGFKFEFCFAREPGSLRIFAIHRILAEITQYKGFDL